jgi:hypothetical protein
MLLWIGRAGVVELATIAETFWSGSPGASSAAARRTRLLVDHGLLDAAIVALDKQNRYTLTARGADLAGPPERGHVLRTRLAAASIAADHFVASADVWSAMSLRLATTSAPRLLRFLTEIEMRRALGNAKGSLIPDGLAIVGHHGRSAVFAIEVDLGNEVPQVFLQKATRYAPLLLGERTLHGLRLDALLVYAPGIPRLLRLAEVVATTGSRESAFFQDLDSLTPATVLERLATVSSFRIAADDGHTNPFSISLVGGAT